MKRFKTGIVISLLTEKLGFTYAVAGMLSIEQRIPALFNLRIGLIADRMLNIAALQRRPK